MSEPTVIGLIAGGRQFPLMVADAVRRAGHRLVIAAFFGHSNMDVAPKAHVFRKLKFGQLGPLIDYFKDNGVQEVIMAGHIKKSRIMDLRHFDKRARALIGRRKDMGDATALTLIAAEFESEGMRVVPPHVHVPELLTPAGVLGRHQPDAQGWIDLKIAFDMGKVLGELDIGQCLVVRHGVVAAMEALEGTDAAIRRGCRLGGPGCVVVKVFKPCQEERADLPSAGRSTIKTMRKGKAVCLGLEAGRSLLFNQEATVRAADQAGISVVGLTPELLAANTPESTESPEE